MLKFFLLIVLQGISGGISGYITNKYAVNMLFKEYTPLKLGGVVKKKRDKFIEEISELVERDIINSKTLKAEIINKNFDVYIKQISEFFFEEGLNNNIGNMKIGEISNFSDSVSKTEEFIRENINQILPEFLDNILNKINLEDILTEKQISQIVRSSYELLVNEIESRNILNESALDLYKENFDMKLSEILSEGVQKKIINNVSENVIEIVNNNILKDEASCEMLLNKIFENINVDNIVSKIQESMGEYSLKKFITDAEEKEIISNIYSKFNRFIISPEGKELVSNFMNELYLIGKNIDFTIYEILPAEMEELLTKFIKTIVPKAMPYISEWISNNKASFDEMIEEAIDEAIDGMDENIKKLVISKVRSALMGDISSKNDIVSKIISYFNDSLNDDSYDKLAGTIISTLKKKKIKDIVQLIEKYNLISSGKAVEFIIKQFNLYGKNIFESIIRAQFEKKINKFIQPDLINLFNTKLKSILYKSIFKNKEKISLQLNKAINSLISIKGYELFNKNLSELFTEDHVHSFSHKFESLTSSILDNNKSIYEEKIKKYMVSKVKDISLISVLESYKVDISESIVDKSISIYKEAVDKNKKREVKELICTYFDKEQLSDILINKGYPMLISKLPNLLDGNIKKFVKNNLNKYDEDEICDIVQEFMGNQLKPLSVFGGILGTVVGIIYQLVFPNSIGWYGFPGSLLNLIMSLAIMAGIGYITNVIALWMIFHPYKENKIISKIPFFKKFALGYIPAHKNQFAVGMAKLIDEELLSKEEINKSFKLHKNDTKSVLMSLVTNNNYQLLIEYVRNKKEDLAQYIYKGILNLFGDKSSIAQEISNDIKEEKVNKFIKRNIFLSIIPKLINAINNTESYLVDLAQRKLSSDYCINDILPMRISEISQYTQIQIEEILQEKIRNANKIDFISMLMDTFKDDYELQIRKSCKDIFEKDFIDKVKNNFEVKTYSYFINDFRVYLNDKIQCLLNNELDENNSIGEMFDGKVKRIVDNNLGVLTNRFTDRVILYLQGNKDELALTVQETIKSNLNFFEKIAYATFGGDDIAYKVVEIILYKKLPIFIKGEMDKITNVASATLEEKIYPMSVSTLKIKADEFNTVVLINNVFEKFDKEIELRNNINKFSDFILEYLISIPLAEYLELCNLHTLDLIHKKFYGELNIMKKEVFDNLNANIENITKILGQFLEERVITPFCNLHNSKIFERISAEDINDTVKNILNRVSSSESIKKRLLMFGEDLYDNKLSEINIEQIIDSDILDMNIKGIVNKAFEDERFNKVNIYLIERIIENAVHNNSEFIDNDSKNDLINITIETGLDSINEYIVPILQEIDLKNITNRQIDLLNPKEIDILFNSFAGDFFSKLRFYGVFGFVFGINVGLSIILWALDVRYSIVSSRKENKVLRKS